MLTLLVLEPHFEHPDIEETHLKAQGDGTVQRLQVYAIFSAIP